MSSELLLSRECRQTDPWDYNTSDAWMHCRKKVLKIRTVIIAVVVVILILIFSLLFKKPYYALAAFCIGVLLLAGVVIFGKRAEEQKYANMISDLLFEMRSVENFPRDGFRSHDANLADILDYAKDKQDEATDDSEKTKYAELGKGISGKYDEFVRQQQENKRSAATADALSRSRSYGNRGVSLDLGSLFKK